MLEPTPLYGGNADFLEGLYEHYLRDPASVDERWRGYFERMVPSRRKSSSGHVRHGSSRPLPRQHPARPDRITPPSRPLFPG